MGFITKLFGGGSTPPPPVIPAAPAPPPTAVDPAVVAARQSALTKGAALFGNDIDTSPGGLNTQANLAKKTALGS